jgi:cytochrome c553
MKKIILLAAVFSLTAAISAFADDATDNWTAMCAKCHGADGKGQTKMGQRLGCRDFTDPKVQADIKDADAFNALRNGLKTDDGKTQMRPFDALTDDQIKALIAYVRTLKAN